MRLYIWIKNAIYVSIEVRKGLEIKLLCTFLLTILIFV